MLARGGSTTSNWRGGTTRPAGPWGAQRTLPPLHRRGGTAYCEHTQQGRGWGRVSIGGRQQRQQRHLFVQRCNQNVQLRPMAVSSVEKHEQTPVDSEHRPEAVGEPLAAGRQAGAEPPHWRRSDQTQNGRGALIRRARRSDKPRVIKQIYNDALGVNPPNTLITQGITQLQATRCPAPSPRHASPPSCLYPESSPLAGTSLLGLSLHSVCHAPPLQAKSAILSEVMSTQLTKFQQLSNNCNKFFPKVSEFLLDMCTVSGEFCIEDAEVRTCGLCTYPEHGSALPPPPTHRRASDSVPRLSSV